MPRISICDDNFDPATMYVNGKGACAIDRRLHINKDQQSSIKPSSKLQDSSDQGLSLY